MSENTNRQDFTGRMRAKQPASTVTNPPIDSSNRNYSGNAPNNSNNVSSPNNSNNNIPNQVDPDYNNTDTGDGNSGIVRGGRGRFIVDAEADTIMSRRAGLIFNGQIGKPGFNFIITDAELQKAGSAPSMDGNFVGSGANGPCTYYKGVMYGEIIPSNDPKYQMSGPTAAYGLTVHQSGLCPTFQESLNCEKISNWPDSLAQCKLARRKGDPDTLYFFCYFSQVPEDTFEIFKYGDTAIVDRGDLGKVILPGTTTLSGYTVKWETTDGNNADIGSTIKIF